MTDIDWEAREWLRGRMTEAGHEASIDGLGAVVGPAPGASRSVLVGSQTDQVPNGGWLHDAPSMDKLEAADGVLTVINSNMANAIRSRTTQKGVDPREFARVDGKIDLPGTKRLRDERQVN